MSFPSAFSPDIQDIEGGERHGNTNLIQSVAFEDGLKVGRFCQVDGDKVKNMDGTADPVLAGVALRLLNMEMGVPEYKSDFFAAADILRTGNTSLDVKDGETAPDLFAPVYCSNAGDDDDGLVTATDTDLATEYRFIRVNKNGTWLCEAHVAPTPVAAP